IRADAHFDVSIHELRRAFRMEGDEVERRARLARGEILAARAVLEKLAEKLSGLWIKRAGGGRAADLQRGADFFDRCGGVVVELVVFLGRSVPVANIRLVPDFEIPFG